jgi:hypothetical protein
MGGAAMTARAPNVRPIRAVQSSCLLSGRKSGPGAAARFDPEAFAVAFPAKWQAFLRGHFRNPVHVAHVFGVTDRAARKWWDGDGGPGGAKVAQAQAMYPAETRMLFAAE